MQPFLKWIGACLIILSIGLFVWLLHGNAQQKQQSDELIDVFQTLQAIDDESVRQEGVMTPSAEEPVQGGMEGVEGILSIPAIDLEAPVLTGADPATLNKGLGAIENLDSPGQLNGSYAIAGHQAHVFGKYFNRLHEMDVGTTFTFQTVEGEMEFTVFDKKIVRPNEVDVLKAQKGIALMSLITCYPEYSNEYRLVVQAERVK